VPGWLQGSLGSGRHCSPAAQAASSVQVATQFPFGSVAPVQGFGAGTHSPAPQETGGQPSPSQGGAQSGIAQVEPGRHSASLVQPAGTGRFTQVPWLQPSGSGGQLPAASHIGGAQAGIAQTSSGAHASSEVQPAGAAATQRP
jgi:hypothetical protein